MKASRGGDVDWADDLFRALRDEGIRHVATVPDGGLSRLLALCEASSEINVITLTTEEEGIALACGSWLGGERTAILMQSSGVGNIVNMLALPNVCDIPCLLIVSMRGEAGEANPWQIPVGSTVARLLETLGVSVVRPDEAAEIGPAFVKASAHSVDHGSAVAILIGQHIIGAKAFAPAPGPGA